MPMDNAVKAILVILTIVATIGMFASLTSPAVRVLMGFADESTLDDNSKDEYIYSRQMNEETINSINALLFSINSIAHYDTNLKTQTEKDAFTDEMFSVEQERKFGATTVRYTLSNIETVFIEDLNSDEGRETLIDALIRCHYMFEDNGKKKTRCFGIESKAASLNFGELKSFATNFRETNSCNENCKETIDTLFNPLALASDKQVVEIDGSIGNNFVICAEPSAGDISHVWTDRVYLSPSLSHHSCDVEREARNDDVLGMKIEDFYLKQDVGPISTLEKFVKGYKPNILYYQMADPVIAQDFEAAIFTFDVWDVIKWELIGSALFDFIPAMKPVRKFAGAWLKSTGKEIVQRAVKEGAEATAEEIGQQWFKELFQEVGEKLSNAKGIGGVYNALKSVIERVQNVVQGIKNIPSSAINKAVTGLLGETGETATDRAIRVMTVKKEIRRSLKLENMFQGEFVDQYLKAAGRSTSELQEEFVEKLSKESFDRMAKGQSGEITEQEFQEAFEDVFGQYKDEMGEFYEYYLKNPRIVTEKYNKEFIERFSGDLGAQMLKEIRINSRIWSKFELRLNRIFNTGIGPEEQLKIVRELMEESPDEVFGEMLSSRNDMRRFLSSFSLDLDAFTKIPGPEGKMLLGAGDIDTFISKVDEFPLSAKYGAALETHMKDLGIKEIVGNPLKKKRHILILGLGFLRAKEVSDEEIFHPIGINSFGYKTSISTPAIFDDYLRKDWDYNKEKKKKDEDNKYHDYFLHYGDSVIPGVNDKKEEEEEEEPSYEEQVYVTEKYTGTIPALRNYFVALIKDQRRFWFDQPPDRFYLVAPCKADVNVQLTQIECWGKPQEAKKPTNLISSLFAKEAKYATGTFNPLLDKREEHFDGKNQMLYQVDENKDIIKLCDKKNLWEGITFDDPYTPMTITVDPVLDRSLEMNYCYEGIDEQMMVANVLLNYAIPIAGGLIGGAACGGVPICLFASGAISGAIGGTAYMALETGAVDKVPGLSTFMNTMGIQTAGYHWPYHSSRGH